MMVLVLVPPAAGNTTQAAPDTPGADQYVESLPAGGGAVAPGLRRASARSVPTNVATRLRKEGGTDAPILGSLVTSADLGAPSRATASGARGGSREGANPRSPRVRAASDEGRPHRAAAVKRSSSMAAALRAVGDSRGPVGLGALALVVVGTGLVLMRRRRQPPG